MKVDGKHYRALEWQGDIGGHLTWIDQCLLPHRFIVRESRDPEAVARAIETMEVRGAPAIGAMAAMGLALAFMTDPERFDSYWLARFRRTRPTAVNLFHACDAMQRRFIGGADNHSMLDTACKYADAEVERSRKIGIHLAEHLAIGERRIQTHCNAGWLATVDWGTALSGIYHLHRSGENPSVIVDETRPRLQGAKLTAWELYHEGIHCHVQVDGAAAWQMALGKVDAVVVGADRIAGNGDVANKIGTYMLALAAREHGIPFYVAAPASTFDTGCATGREIVIENRDPDEVLSVSGTINGMSGSVWITENPIAAVNPAFDVTPSHLITAIVNEEGVWKR